MTQGNITTVLILRSGPQGRVSKDGPDRRPCLWPSFETPCCAWLLMMRSE
jgi:hypothetical protein